MTQYRPGQLADLLGVSADTVRRWCDEGRLATVRTEGGHRLVEGSELARFVRDEEEAYAPEALQVQSAQIDGVSGATFTSNAYAQALQSALDQLH